MSIKDWLQKTPSQDKKKESNSLFGKKSQGEFSLFDFLLRNYIYYRPFVCTFNDTGSMVDCDQRVYFDIGLVCTISLISNRNTQSKILPTDILTKYVSFMVFVNQLRPT